MSTVPIFTDGACRGNSRPGGWGALLRLCTREKELWGEDHSTTNNRMELMAVSKGLEPLKRQGRVELTTDSQYVREGITEWIKIWKARGCKTGNKKPVKNDALWRCLEGLADQHEMSWHRVEGHSGRRENEIARNPRQSGY